MHLTLLNLDLKAPRRVHALALLLKNLVMRRLIVIQCQKLALGPFQQIVEASTELNRRRKLFDKGVAALQTVELLEELGLGVVDGQAVHPAEPVADVGVGDGFFGLHEPLEAQRQLVVDEHEGQRVVQRLRFDLLEGKRHDEKRGRDADVRCVETFCSADECGDDNGQVAVM